MFPGCAVNSIHFRKHIPSPFFFTFFITRMGTFFKEGKAFAGHSILIKIYTKPDSPTSNMWWCKRKIWRGCCCFHKSTATKKFADSQLPTKYYLVPLFHRLFRKLFFFQFSFNQSSFFFMLLHDFKTWAFIWKVCTEREKWVFLLPLCAAFLRSDMRVHLLNIQKKNLLLGSTLQSSKKMPAV